MSTRLSIRWRFDAAAPPSPPSPCSPPARRRRARPPVLGVGALGAARRRGDHVAGLLGQHRSHGEDAGGAADQEASQQRADQDDALGAGFRRSLSTFCGCCGLFRHGRDGERENARRAQVCEGTPRASGIWSMNASGFVSRNTWKDNVLRRERLLPPKYRLPLGTNARPGSLCRARMAAFSATRAFPRPDRRARASPRPWGGRAWTRPMGRPKGARLVRVGMVPATARASRAAAGVEPTASGSPAPAASRRCW